MGTAPYSNDSTSRDAAESLTPEHLAKQERVVLSVIQEAYDSGEVGRTLEETSDITGIKWSTASARIWQLVHERGRLIDSGEKRRNRSGRRAIVWRPTHAGEVAPGQRMRKYVVEALERQREKFGAVAREVVEESIEAGVWNIYAVRLPGMESRLGLALRALEKCAE